MSADPRDVLREFGAKRASADAVMRALVRHRGWLVSATWIAARGIKSVGGKIVMFGSEYKLPANTLWVFTDRAAAERAQAGGAVLGPFVEGWDGVDLFASLGATPAITELKVNPGSASAETWFIEKKGFAIAALWASANRVERALEELLDSSYAFVEDPKAWKAQLDVVRTYDGWVIPMQKGSNNIVGLPQGPTKLGLLFSAPDAMDAFVAASPPNVKAMLGSGNAKGDALFAEYERQGFDAIGTNMFGPSRPVPIPLIALVDALAATR